LLIKRLKNLADIADIIAESERRAGIKSSKAVQANV
jgi:hypothetical protein